MEETVGNLTAVCICDLSLKHHVGKQLVRDAVQRLVAAGKLHETTWAGETVYTASGQPVDLDAVMPLVAQIESARSVLREVWPEYRDGVELCDQGEIGQEIKRVLRECVGQLTDRGLLPPYWRNESFNAPCLILAFRDVLGDPAAVRQFLSEVRGIRTFDVFLCHNSEDKPVVKEIAQRLKQRGISPWLDEWELPPGRPWQSLLETQIGAIRSAAVFVGRNGIGPWQQQEIDACLREFVRRGCPVIPVLLRDAPAEPVLPLFLKGMTWVDFRKPDPEPLAQLSWGIMGSHPGHSAGEHYATAARTVSRCRSEKWVDSEYPAAAGIVRDEQAKGYRLSWCPDELLARRVDIEGYELVTRSEPDGTEVTFRLRDRPSNQTLLRKKEK
jgi:TIR domain